MIDFCGPSRNLSKNSSFGSLTSSFRSSFGGGAKKALEMCPTGIGAGLKKLQGIGGKSLKSLSGDKRSNNSIHSAPVGAVSDVAKDVPIEVPIDTPVELPASSCITITPSPVTMPSPARTRDISLPRCSCSASPRRAASSTHSPRGSSRSSPKLSPQLSRLNTPEPLPKSPRARSPSRLSSRPPPHSSRSPPGRVSSTQRAKQSSAVSPSAAARHPSRGLPEAPFRSPPKIEPPPPRSSPRRENTPPRSPSRHEASPSRSPSRRRTSDHRSSSPGVTRPGSPVPPRKYGVRLFPWKPVVRKPALGVPPSSPPRPPSPDVPSVDPNDPQQLLYNQIQNQLLGYFAKDDPPNRILLWHLLDKAAVTRSQIAQKESEEKSKKFLLKYCLPDLPSSHHVPLIERAELTQECINICHRDYGFVFMRPTGYWSEDLVDFFACGTVIPLTKGEPSRDPSKEPYKNADGNIDFWCDCKANTFLWNVFDRYGIKFKPFVELQTDPSAALEYLSESFEGTNLELLSDADFKMYIKSIARKMRIPDPDQEPLYRIQQGKEAGGQDNELAEPGYWENMQFYKRPSGN
nr:PREDICTED: proline-rich protein 36-like [Bemisia tabaci]